MLDKFPCDFMKKLFTFIFCLATISANATTQIKLGTYNIKSYSSSAIEQHQWSARKKYVVQLVIDNGYDIIGMNEIRSIGNQHDDMNSMMADAGFDAVEGNSTEANACYNSVYYKRDLFEVLDKGVYFLSPDGTPRLAWDMNNSLVRFTTWAKFRAKDTGDVFFFFSTHHDVSGSFARYEETRMNVDSVRSIASFYPAFLAGDFNTSPGDGVFYNYSTTYMDDCRTTARNVVAPIGDGTLCHHTVDGAEVWDPQYSAVRLDYIFARNVVSVDEYVNVNTAYLALHNECPSDHFAIQATVTIGETKAEDFTITFQPQAESLQDAVDRCACDGTLMLPAGTVRLTSPLHITRPINIVGGSPSTTLMGDGSSRVIVADAKTALTLRNIGICGGQSATDGGGIYCGGTYLGLFNCTLHDNHATGNGGAIYAGGQLEIRNCRIYNNVCEANGAAFFTPANYWHHSVIGSHIYSNKGATGSAGYIGGFSHLCITANSIHDNESSTSGTLHIERMGAKSFATIANNTIANNISAGAGSAIETYQPAGTIALVNNTIVGNCSKVDDACAVYMKDATVANIYSNIIAGNQGGDIAIGNQNTIVNNVCNTVTNDDATTKLSIMLQGKVDGSRFIPSLNEQGIIPVKTPFFGNICINDVTAEMLEEKTFGGDVDNNAEMIQRLTTDQIGNIRHTDGTATRGAVEVENTNVWDGVSVSEPDVITTGRYKGYRLITRPEELAWVGTMTETIPFDENLYIASDLNLGNHPWMPIGKRHPFRGSIEGNNRLISGISITATDGSIAALIAQADNASAYINDLRLAGKIIADSATYVGALVGKVTAMKSITCIHSAVDIEISDADSCIIGCIAGDAEGTLIAGCSYSGTTNISGNAQTGVFSGCTISSVYSNGVVEGKIENRITAPTDLVFQVGSDGISTSQLHSGELTRKLNNGSPSGYFGQDMGKPNSVPVTRTEENTVYQTQYLIGDSIYNLSYNNHTLIFPSDPKVEGYIFRGWYDALGNRLTSRSVISSDTVLYALIEPLEKWDGTSVSEPTKIDNPDSPCNGWYQINKPAELAWVASKTKTATFDGNLYIANDIDLDNRPWSPIGYNYNFNGSIEGNGYTVWNISLYPGANVKCYGFIGQTNNSSATISNLTITGTMLIETSSKSANVGALIGKANGIASITNCHSQMNITTKKGSLVSYLGGIVGLVKNTDIVSCSYSGTMSLEGGQVAKGWGGLVGTFNSTVEGDQGALRNSWFCGKIHSTTTVKPTYGAALVGYPSLSGGTCLIENCYACGEFTATTKPTNYGVIYAKKGTGTVVSNNYSVCLTANTSDEAIPATADQLTGGELCWLLNQGNTTTPYYYQNIDKETVPDTIPLADKTHGIVYRHHGGTYSNFPEAPEAIETIQSSPINHQSSIYNLQGLPVRKDYRGIVIDAGKKYLVR